VEAAVIEKPGIYDIPEAEYHADPCPVPSLSSSLCKTLLYRSPMHAWMEHPRLNPNFVPTERAEFDLGTAAHAMFLEGKNTIEVIDPKNYPGKKGGIPDGWTNDAIREARDKARAAGKIPMLPHQYANVVEMVGAAKIAWAANEDLSGIPFLDGKVEQSLIWREGPTWLRARPDWLSNDRKLIVDYKTTGASASPEDWVRTMLGCGYDIQAPFYLRGNRATGGADGAKFVFLVQECEPPYACSWIGMPPAFIALGEAKVERAVNTWRACVAADGWPGYPSRICWVEPPSWAETKWAERTEHGEDEDGIPYDIDKLFGKRKETA
jgi:PDDEXK-like domain of unknown function (DUF3799)